MGSNLSCDQTMLVSLAHGLSFSSHRRTAACDLRLNFTWRHKHELEAAVQTMLSWELERIIFAHGRWHDANGTTERRKAFRWLLK